MGIVIFNDTLEGMENVSFIGIFGILIFVITLIIIYIYKIIYNLTLPKFTFSLFIWKNDISQLLSSLPTVILSYSFQFNVFAVYFTLKKPNQKQMMVTSGIGVIFCFFIYSITGVIGYLMYGEELNDTTSGLSTGAVDIEIVEYNQDNQPFDQDGTMVMPGDEIILIPRVNNLGIDELISSR